jgi:hypothetical protein
MVRCAINRPPTTTFRPSGVVAQRVRGRRLPQDATVAAPPVTTGDRGLFAAFGEWSAWT